jgi:hypothetical protein
MYNRAFFDVRKLFMETKGVQTLKSIMRLTGAKRDQTLKRKAF